MFCKYCGKEAQYQFKNGVWCCSPHRNKCPVQRLKISRKTKEQFDNLTDSEKERRKKIRKGYWENPSYRQKMCYERHHRWDDPEYSNRAFGIGKRRADKSYGSEIARKGWQNLTEEQKISRQRKAILSSSSNDGPNKIEKYWTEYLYTLSTNWKYTGGGEFAKPVGIRFPDWTNEKEHKIIEHAGNYWHDCSYEQDRIDYYKSFGYICLVIWDTESKEQAKQKIRKFVEVAEMTTRS